MYWPPPPPPDISSRALPGGGRDVKKLWRYRFGPSWKSTLFLVFAILALIIILLSIR